MPALAGAIPLALATASIMTGGAMPFATGLGGYGSQRSDRDSMTLQFVIPADAGYLRERVRRLEALAHVQSKLAEAELDLDEFMQLAIDELEYLVGAGGVVLELADGEH